MRDKWHIKNKKGYLKIHVAVNVKTKKILSIKVTDARVHDSKALPGLVNDVIKLEKRITVGKLIAEDGAYEDNEIFRHLGDNGILPCIKVKKNSRIRWKKGNILRNLTVLAQKNDLQKWKDSV
ncbi:MAG TPA: transposase, partial [Candidatus Nitrosocosmicus sp.]